MSHFHKDLDRDGSEVKNDSKVMKAENVTSPERYED